MTEKDALDELFAEIERLIPLNPETCVLRCALRAAAVKYGCVVREQTAAMVREIWRVAR